MPNSLIDKEKATPIYRDGLSSLTPLTDEDATVLFLIVMESAFDNLNLIVNYPVDQSVFLVNSSGPKAGIIKF